MKTLESNTNDYRFFTAVTLGWVFWLWIGLILTLGNVFYAPLLWSSLAITVFGTVYIICKRKLFKGLSREFSTVSLFSIVIAVFITSFTVPTIFSGRDQGSYSNAAIRLSENHQLAFSTPASEAFFKIYGPGKALNFPGFDYTTDGKLTTQFPLGYIVWLASLFALFGLFGLIVANTFTTALFLIAFYLLLRLFVSRFSAIWGFVIAATSLPIVWFSKITLSENLALALFTLLALNLVLVFKEKSRFFALATIALAGFFAFTRIEGIIFLAIIILILAFSPSMRTFWKSKPFTYAILPAIIFFILFARGFFVNIPFYKAIAKAGLSKWRTLLESCTGDVCATDKAASLWGIFWSYGLIPVFIIGTVSIFIFFKHRNRLALIPFFLALPTFFYLVQPSISIDHPWMLRRFVFSIYPTMLFSSVLGIALIQEFLTKKYPSSPLFTRRYYAGILFVMLFLSQLPFALSYANFADNKGLLMQTEAISRHFSGNDLVLIDRGTTGDAWSMIAEPFSRFGIVNAVYFFNPEDFATLNTEGFDHVYLVAPESEVARYTQAVSQDSQAPLKRFTPVATETFDTQRLEQTTDTLSIPRAIQTRTNVSILKVE